jgi:hypothetical protein
MEGEKEGLRFHFEMILKASAKLYIRARGPKDLENISGITTKGGSIRISVSKRVHIAMATSI